LATRAVRAESLTDNEIETLVYDWISVSEHGHLGDFSYRPHDARLAPIATFGTSLAIDRCFCS